MKNSRVTIFTAWMLMSVFSVACNKDNTGKTGTFTIDNTSYTGNTETQTFVNNSYSVICQQDEPFKLIQVTFHNQAEAEAGGVFTVDDYTYSTIPSGAVNIGVDGLTFDPAALGYTVHVSNKHITASSNITLVSTDGSGAMVSVNSVNIDF